MIQDNKTLQTLMTITQISNNAGLRFDEKLQQIIQEVVKCMQVEKGSIMLLRGRSQLEVAASTNPEIIGMISRLDEGRPSAWVVKNKKPLYVDESSKPASIQFTGSHYKKNAFLLIPILHKGRILGVLSVTDKIGEDRFSPQEREMLLEIVGYLISSIENQRLNTSLKKSQQALQQKNQQLKNLEKVRTELFNMLVHDLKGPISEVTANLDILSYTVTGEDKEYVSAAQTGCDTLYRMILDLLDIARLEEGSLKIIQEKIVARDFVTEAMSLVHGQARMKSISLIPQHDATEGNAFFYGDRNLLLRVMQNLMVNAIQCSPQGERIEVGFMMDGNDRVQLFVADNGPGILPEFQEAVFNKFFQINKKKDGRRYSTGLGLTFCKLAVTAHRGEIYVNSDGVKGSRFVFIIPAGRPASGQAV
ncbi:MAG: ATP-binding protein [Thermodesulfobacteriota bacterium]